MAVAPALGPRASGASLIFCRNELYFLHLAGPGTGRQASSLFTIMARLACFRAPGFRLAGGAGMFLGAVGTALAQGQMGPPGQKSTGPAVTLIELFNNGGIMMYPLLGLSIVATGLILFYTVSIRQDAVVSDRFMDEAETLIRKGDYLGLLQNAHLT